MGEKDFWQDQENAMKVSKEAALLKEEVVQYENLVKEIEEIEAIDQLAEAERDHELEAEIKDRFPKFEQEYLRLEFLTLFSGKYDKFNAVISIHAGAGGDDAQDWAAMLLRMYLRFVEQKGWQAKILDESRGSEAGVKSVTFEVEGPYAYGHLKGETGVHRLVRISPFDAEKMRHTSFAYVEALPVLDDVEVKIDDRDIRVDTFLSSGHGGQSVQTTYSAVRLVHEPTGIIVTVQNERSQRQNKEKALQILQSRLLQLEEAKQEEERQRLRGQLTEAAWGNQIRSYVLHPYKMVKDHRTDYEEQDVAAVLDGGLQRFAEEYLKQAQTINKK